MIDKLLIPWFQGYLTSELYLVTSAFCNSGFCLLKRDEWILYWVWETLWGLLIYKNNEWITFKLKSKHSFTKCPTAGILVMIRLFKKSSSFEVCLLFFEVSHISQGISNDYDPNSVGMLCAKIYFVNNGKGSHFSCEEPISSNCVDTFSKYGKILLLAKKCNFD